MDVFRNILIEIEDRIATITINRESKLNALTAETLQEIRAAVLAIQQDKEVWGMILTGAGEKAFVAGADITEFLGLSMEEGMQLSKDGHEVMNTLYHSSKPIVAVINGFALGGGLELALACHLRIASKEAKMGLPEVSLGIIPGYGGTQRLTELVGRGKALEMILTADMISAADALQWGLVNYVEEASEAKAKAISLLNQMFKRSKIAIAQAIEAVNAGLDKNQNGYQLEIDSFGKNFVSADFKEGVAAFLEKRKPNF